MGELAIFGRKAKWFSILTFYAFIGIRLLRGDTMATQRVSFCKFVPIGACDLDSVVLRLLEKSDEANRFVFNEQANQYISGCYLVQQTRNEITYNAQENRFESITTSKLVVAKFEVDLQKSALIIWGNRNIAQKLITLLSQACNNQVIIDVYQANFKRILQKLVKLEDITFSKMKLENVVIDHGITASCNISLVHLDDAKELVKKYSENISQLSLFIGNRLEENSVSLTLFSSGSIVIYKDRDSISDEIVAEIQHIAIE
ncbi:hypothetical protein [Bacteroides caecimuris]|uniref:hypothetical protein n=1 Tax=Bacteroides caecimuris TaxID=1796613 RepID=UPI0025724582|nr:hypothetical protein [Bacteroides caecimuris]